MSNPMSGSGRHRAPRARLTLAQRLGAAAVLLGATGFAAATWPTAAVADAPVQTAWYNAVSGGGQAAPDPTTPAGGLHVAVSSSQILAFGAVQYLLTAGSTATIEFDVSNLTATPVVNPTSPSTTPAANIVACPITGTWKAGDDQAMDAAPTYDCNRSIFGSLSADQKTLTFLADTSLETVPGQLSLAIVPVVTDEIPGAGTPAPFDTTQPFSLDLAKPDASSLTVTSTAAVPPPPPAPKSGGTTSAQGSTQSGSATTSSGSASGPSSVSLPGATTGSASTSSTTDAGSTPVVAPTNAAPNAAPAAAAAPAKNDRAHNAALAMLLLIGLGIIAMSSGQMQRAPRLLGGAGRHAAVAGTAGAAATAPMPVMAMTPYGNRGLGRFAKARTEPARPLM